MIGGFCVPATQLKPDEGTPDLPAGLVRVRMETDGTLHDVMEHDIHKVVSLSPLTSSVFPLPSLYFSSLSIPLSHGLSLYNISNF